MDGSYKPTLYELKTTHGLALSPWCWHARMALAHKGIKPDIIRLCFTEKEPIQALGGKTFPVMQEADGTVFTDSKDIALRLEETHPTPPLFPGGEAGRAFYRFVLRHIQTVMMPSLVKIVVADIPDLLDGDDRAYFITSREARFGKPLDEFCANREQSLQNLSQNIDPYRKALEGGGFVSGTAPAMADYLLFGVLQWARVSSHRQLFAADDAISVWMEVMLDLFDGLGRSTPARKR